MRVSKRQLATSVLGVLALGIGGVLGGVASAAVTGNDTPIRDNPGDHGQPPEYEVNSNGQTFGSALDARSPAEEPDLISAYGDDGTLGYVRSADIRAPELTLEEVRADIEARARGVVPLVQTVPLYSEDGQTVIGTFTIIPTTGSLD